MEAVLDMANQWYRLNCILRHFPHCLRGYKVQGHPLYLAAQSGVQCVKLQKHGSGTLDLRLLQGFKYAEETSSLFQKHITGTYKLYSYSSSQLLASSSKSDSAPESISSLSNSI